MANFSKKITNFLTKTGVKDKKFISEVPKSISCGVPGDILIFRYRPKYKKFFSSRGKPVYKITKSKRVQNRILLITEPVIKDAKTGSILLTGFDVPSIGQYTPESLLSLYTERRLPQNGYRTFILQNIVGPLYRIKT